MYKILVCAIILSVAIAAGPWPSVKYYKNSDSKMKLFELLDDGTLMPFMDMRVHEKTSYELNQQW